MIEKIYIYVKEKMYGMKSTDKEMFIILNRNQIQSNTALIIVNMINVKISINLRFWSNSVEN
jgi:hypothetical protein